MSKAPYSDLVREVQQSDLDGESKSYFIEAINLAYEELHNLQLALNRGTFGGRHPWDAGFRTHAYDIARNEALCMWRGQLLLVIETVGIRRHGVMKWFTKLLKSLRSIEASEFRELL